MAGARYDRIDLRSRQPLDKLLLPSANNLCLDSSCVEEQAEGATGGWSWTFSLSYALPFGFVPYVTLSGIPDRIVSVTGTYDFGNGIAASASVVDVAGTTSGFSGSVELPAYRLVNVGVVVEDDRWRVAATAKNLTDEHYFRANFPNLFGSVVVLPELPRHYALRIQYRW